MDHYQRLFGLGNAADDDLSDLGTKAPAAPLPAINSKRGCGADVRTLIKPRNAPAQTPYARSRRDSTKERLREGRCNTR